MSETTEWVLDHGASDAYAKMHPRDKNAPPHWLRCDYTRTKDGVVQRCVLGDGHVGEHKELKT